MPIQTKYDLRPGIPLRPTHDAPHRCFISSDFPLQDRIAYLRWVDSELAYCQIKGDLKRELVKKAHEVFVEFGKTVAFAVMSNPTTHCPNATLIYTPHPPNPKNIGVYFANFIPENLPHAEVLARAQREQAIIQVQEGTEEFLALPFVVTGTQIAWGLMVLTNQPSHKPFTPDDIEIARLFTQIATDALTEYHHRQALS